MNFVISHEVSVKADTMKGCKNPYITLHELECLCQGNETLEFCLEDMVNYSMRYAETVCRFEQIIARGQKSNVDGTRKEIEHTRSTIHDSTIDAINIFSRELKNSGKDNRWLLPIMLGSRAGYGKFAILLAFEAVAEARLTEVV
jgi:hypothetical protein